MKGSERALQMIRDNDIANWNLCVPGADVYSYEFPTTQHLFLHLLDHYFVGLLHHLHQSL